MKLCKTSTKTSETKSATEFSVEVDVDKYQISGLQMSIVDTPGMCDTEGLEQDARNVRAIQKYAVKALGAGIYPNMILLLIKGSDNRFVGKNSKLSKIIRSLGTLKVIDEKHPNLLVVITHVMGLSPKKWESRRLEIQDCVREVCSIEVPVVFVENDFEGFDLPKDERTTCSQLPNGDVQPHNVCEAMFNQMDKVGDSLGHIALKEVYARGDLGLSAKETMNVDSSNSELLLTIEERYIRKLLEDVGEDSEVEQHLTKHQNKFDKVNTLYQGREDIEF